MTGRSKLKKWLTKVGSVIPDALAICGGVLIWRGVDLIHRPTGLIIAGALVITAAIILVKGGKHE